MGKINTSDIYKIALNVRNWAEGIWLNEYRTDLCGCCVIASAKLMNELQKSGFDAKLRISEFHGYVMVGKFIVDVTATQFDIDDVVVIETERQFLNKWGFINGIASAYGLQGGSFETFSTIAEAIHHQRKFNWPEEQSVSTFLEVM